MFSCLTLIAPGIANWGLLGVLQWVMGWESHHYGRLRYLILQPFTEYCFPIGVRLSPLRKCFFGESSIQERAVCQVDDAVPFRLFVLL